MINEDMTERELNLAVRVGNTAAEELRKALEKLIAKLEQLKHSNGSQGQSKDLSNNPSNNQSSHSTQSQSYSSNKNSELRHGKQTLKQLHQHNEGLSSVELKSPNLRKLRQSMKKYDIDFACVKDGRDKYTLFFKGKNAEEMTHAFKRYTGQMVKTADKKAIKADLKEAKAQARLLDNGRDKVKDRSKGVRDR